MSYGSSSYGEVFLGGGQSLFQLSSAASINPSTIVLTFSEGPDLSSRETLDPSNYFIQGVADASILSVKKVASGSDPYSIQLVTGEQSYLLYQVTVSNNVQSVLGSQVDPSANTGNFTGFPSVGRMRAQSVRPDGVVVSFNQPMSADVNFIAPSSYVITGPTGVVVPVTMVTPNLVSNPTQVTLQLSVPLSGGVFYSLTVSSLIQTTLGLLISPSTSEIRGFNSNRTVRIPLSRFTGEVQAPPSNPGLVLEESLQLSETLSVDLTPYRSNITQELLTLVEEVTVTSSRTTEKLQFVNYHHGFVDVTIDQGRSQDTRSTSELSLAEGLQLRERLTILPDLTKSPNSKLFGNPQGLVFFSPSLVPGGVSNSILQVAHIKTCTQAQDVYTFPQPIDPIPLFTHGGGIFVTPTITALNNSTLFADPFRLNEARIDLSDLRQELVPPPVDISVDVSSQEEDPTLVARLNSPGWLLFANPLPPVGDFIPADDHTSPAWVYFDAHSPSAYPFITVNNLAPLPPPVDQPTQHFVNPSEALILGESATSTRSVHASVSESLSIHEDFDLTPGINQSQVNLSESLAVSDSLSLVLGVHLSDSLSLSENLTLTP